jgi:predicted DsbA family dithiol-disulfide isomerase
MAELFGAERIQPMREHLQKVAEHFGISGMRMADHLPNTRRALRLAEVARDEGKLEEFRNRAMDAHWLQQRDLEDENVLRELAAESGLSPDALERSHHPHYAERVDQMREEANEMGVGGIPTFILEPYGVVGAQPYEAFQELARRAGAEKRK